MTDLSYSHSRPPEGKQVFSIDNVVSINYLDKLIHCGSRPHRCKSTLIRQNIPRACAQWPAKGQSSEQPFLGLCRVWAVMACCVNLFSYTCKSARFDFLIPLSMWAAPCVGKLSVAHVYNCSNWKLATSNIARLIVLTLGSPASPLYLFSTFRAPSISYFKFSPSSSSLPSPNPIFRKP